MSVTIQSLVKRYQQRVATATQHHLQKSQPEKKPSLEDWLQADQQLRKKYQWVLFAVLSGFLFLAVAAGIYWGGEKTEQQSRPSVVEKGSEAPKEQPSQESHNQQILAEVEALEQLIAESQKVEPASSSPKKQKEVAVQPQPTPPVLSKVSEKKLDQPPPRQELIPQEKKGPTQVTELKQKEHQTAVQSKSAKVEKEALPAPSVVQQEKAKDKTAETAPVQPAAPQAIAQPVSSASYVQLGSFRNQKRAGTVMNDLKESGFKIVMEQTEQGGEPLYLLRDYSAGSKAQALRLKKIYDSWFSLDSIVRY